MDPVHLQKFTFLLYDFLILQLILGQEIYDSLIKGLLPYSLELSSLHEEFVVYHTDVIIV